MESQLIGMNCFSWKPKNLRTTHLSSLQSRPVSSYPLRSLGILQTESQEPIISIPPPIPTRSLSILTNMSREMSLIEVNLAPYRAGPDYFVIYHPSSSIYIGCRFIDQKEPSVEMCLGKMSNIGLNQVIFECKEVQQGRQYHVVVIDDDISPNVWRKYWWIWPVKALCRRFLKMRHWGSLTDAEVRRRQATLDIQEQI